MAGPSIESSRSADQLENLGFLYIWDSNFAEGKWGDDIAATDFFTTEIWTLNGLVRNHVLFVIRLATREVKVVGVVPEPYGEWMMQMGRNLLDNADGFLVDCRYLNHDRGKVFTSEFRKLLGGSGVRPVRLPRKSPILNGLHHQCQRKAA